MPLIVCLLQISAGAAEPHVVWLWVQETLPALVTAQVASKFDLATPQVLAFSQKTLDWGLCHAKHRRSSMLQDKPVLN